jgi:hypothetical protein
MNVKSLVDKNSIEMFLSFQIAVASKSDKYAMLPDLCPRTSALASTLAKKKLDSRLEYY